MNNVVNNLIHKKLDIWTELYLVLPVFLWVANWLVWPVAVPVILGMLFVVLKHIGLQSRLGDDICEKEYGGFFSFGFCLLVAACITFMVGFDGRLRQFDDFIVRNAIYGELITAEWPPITQDAQYVIYNLQFWLPPALISSWCPEAKTIILQLWHWGGMGLFTLQLFRILGGKRLLVFLCCLMMIIPLTWSLQL